MSITAATGRAQLDIGKVMQDIINVLLRNIVPFGMMTVLLSGVPSIITGVGGYFAATNPILGLLTLPVTLLRLAANPILQGALIYGSMRDLSGDRASAGECLRVGASRWGSMLGLLILMGLGIGFGTLLLIVPGVLLALRWCLSGPVLIMERGRGIGDAMSRSVDLTRGNRGSIFLLLLIYAVIMVVYEAIVVTAGGGIMALTSRPIIALGLTPLINMVSTLMLSVAVAVLYRELRGDNTSASGEALAEVFA